MITFRWVGEKYRVEVIKESEYSDYHRIEINSVTVGFGPKQELLDLMEELSESLEKTELVYQIGLGIDK